MNPRSIIETTVYVMCPLYGQIQKVYARSIPEKQLHFCNGCENMSGSQKCSDCVRIVTLLLQEEKIKMRHNTLDEILNQDSSESIGTYSNPLWLK